MVNRCRLVPLLLAPPLHTPAFAQAGGGDRGGGTGGVNVHVGSSAHVSAAVPRDPHGDLETDASPADARELLACSMVYTLDSPTSDAVTYTSSDSGKSWLRTLVTKGATITGFGIRIAAFATGRCRARSPRDAAPGIRTPTCGWTGRRTAAVTGRRPPALSTRSAASWWRTATRDPILAGRFSKAWATCRTRSASATCATAGRPSPARWCRWAWACTC